MGIIPTDGPWTFGETQHGAAEDWGEAAGGKDGESEAGGGAWTWKRLQQSEIDALFCVYVTATLPVMTISALKLNANKNQKLPEIAFRSVWHLFTPHLSLKWLWYILSFCFMLSGLQVQLSETRRELQELKASLRVAQKEKEQLLAEKQVKNSILPAAREHLESVRTEVC